jgi:hypothetical protein
MIQITKGHSLQWSQKSLFITIISISECQSPITLNIANKRETRYPADQTLKEKILNLALVVLLLRGKVEIKELAKNKGKCHILTQQIQLEILIMFKLVTQKNLRALTCIEE